MAERGLPSILEKFRFSNPWEEHVLTILAVSNLFQFDAEIFFLKYLKKNGKENLTEPGFKPETSGLLYRCSYI